MVTPPTDHKIVNVAESLVGEIISSWHIPPPQTLENPFRAWKMSFFIII